MFRRQGSIFALILIVAGALLFLDNLGLLPIQNIQAYWPLALVFWGAMMIERRRNANTIIGAGTIIVFGALLTLGNLHIIRVTGGIIWSLALIAAGLVMLVGRCQMPANLWPPKPPPFETGSYTQQSYFGDKLMEQFIFSGTKRRVETHNFQGGKVEAVFGGAEMDLSGSTIAPPNRRVVLIVNAIFGGVEIKVPRTWRIEKIGSAVFGGFDDQTVPPRPEPGFDPPTLVIRGSSVFGGIVIKN
ncbi:MAG TPA: DUF5668 domain-containing protein [Bryobacteraceae bacterium]|jgi:hypothetical protein|nr:DUF5668 domain-containing protein [Bryobacteraceae bacterium]